MRKQKEGDGFQIGFVRKEMQRLRWYKSFYQPLKSDLAPYLIYSSTSKKLWLTRKAQVFVLEK